MKAGGMAKLIDRLTLQSYVNIPDQFRDTELRTATFRMTGNRLSMWSGGRAAVFQAQMPGGAKLAVRISITPEGDHLRAPYLALADWIKANPLPYLARTEWVDRGLDLEGTEIALLKMEWIDGSSLDDHIDNCLALNRPAELSRLAEEWRKAAGAMTTARFAHGDLHAQNVLVSRSDAEPRFRLVDYDSLWLPGLTNAPVEVGHQAFQHPRREWGEHMDAFGAAVIYLSLRATAMQPHLWTKFHRGDMTLVIEESDLHGDDDRGVWSEMAKHDDSVVRSLATELRRWCDQPAAKHPNLESVLRGVKGGNFWPPTERKPGTTLSSTPSAPIKQAWPSPQSDLAPPSRPPATWGAPGQPKVPPTGPSPIKGKQTWPGTPLAAPPSSSPPPNGTGPASPKRPTHPTTTEWLIIAGIVLVLLIALL
jgi:eukaryotic-like serine/threonine-protein kinase